MIGTTVALFACRHAGPLVGPALSFVCGKGPAECLRRVTYGIAIEVLIGSVGPQ
jgi:hypothetical protein